MQQLRKYKMETCPLCELSENKNIIHTKVWYENDSFIICNCDTCEGGDKVPMVVLKRHSMTLGSAELAHLVNVLYELFGGFYHLRFEQRKIKDHFHIHVIIGE